MNSIFNNQPVNARINRNSSLSEAKTSMRWDDGESSGEDLASILNEAGEISLENKRLVDGASSPVDESLGAIVFNDIHENELNLKNIESPTRQGAPHATISLLRQDESDSIRQLIGEVACKTASLRSLELQLSHSSLKMQALACSEAQLRRERDDLHQAVAISEQDILLLEAKLKSIAAFESRSSPYMVESTESNSPSLIEEIKGHLLKAANDKIGELTFALNNIETRVAEKKDSYERDIVRLTCDNEALRKEIQSLSDQLAQRAVLYNAQERRWSESIRIMNSHTEDSNKEVIELRARIQQLESQYDKTDRERIEAVMTNRQFTETSRQLEKQLLEYKERLIGIDQELADASALNISLQGTIDRLRGSDMEILERDLTKEVEIIREEGRLRENSLRKQLDDTRDRLNVEVEQRERLLDEIQCLRSDLEDKSNLLRLAATSHYNKALPVVLPSTLHVLPEDNEYFGVNDVNDDSQFDHTINDHVNTSSEDNSQFAAMFDVNTSSVSEMSALTEPDIHIEDVKDESQAIVSVSPSRSQNRSHSNSKARSRRYTDVADENQDPEERIHVGYLTGNDDIDWGIGMELLDESVGDSKTTHSSLTDKDEEIEALKVELRLASQRELNLRLALKTQASKLALVLRKAAEMGPQKLQSQSQSLVPSNSQALSKAFSDNDAVVELKRVSCLLNEKNHSLGCLEAECVVLREQLQTYRSEIHLLERQMQQNKELGACQASLMFETKISGLESQVNLLVDREASLTSQCKVYLDTIDSLKNAVTKRDEEIKCLTSTLPKVKSFEDKSVSASSDVEEALTLKIELDSHVREIHRLEDLLQSQECQLLQLRDLVKRRDAAKICTVESFTQTDVTMARSVEIQTNENDVEHDTDRLQRLILSIEEQWREKMIQMENNFGEEKRSLTRTHQELRESFATFWQQELERQVDSLNEGHRKALEALKVDNELRVSNERERCREKESEFLQEIQRLKCQISDMIEKRSGDTSLFAHKHPSFNDPMQSHSFEVSALHEHQQQHDIITIQQCQQQQQQIELLQHQLQNAEAQRELALSALRLELKHDHQESISALQATHLEDLRRCRKLLSSKYRHALSRQQRQFAKEKDELAELVKRECEEIVKEAHQMVKNARIKVPGTLP